MDACLAQTKLFSFLFVLFIKQLRFLKVKPKLKWSARHIHKIVRTSVVLLIPWSTSIERDWALTLCLMTIVSLNCIRSIQLVTFVTI